MSTYTPQLRALDWVLSHERGIPYTCVNVRRTPRFDLFHLQLLSTRYLRTVLKMADEFAVALGCDNVRVVRRQEAVDIEVPLHRTQWQRVPVSSMVPTHQRPAFAVGQDPTGHTRYVDLAKPNQAHVVIAGMTGSGKTFLLASITAQLARLAPDRLKLLILDLKNERKVWGPLAKLPHLIHPIIIDAQEAHQAIRWVNGELDRRIQQGRPAGSLVVIIDEMAHLIDSPDGSLAQAIGKATSVGRGKGVHFILGVQQPNAKTMGSLTNAQVGVRVVGRVAKADYAYHATGLPGTGAEKLCGAGDMILVQNSVAERIAAPYPDKQMLTLLPTTQEVPKLEFGQDKGNGRGNGQLNVAVLAPRIAFALDRYQAKGLSPSANSIQQEFKGAMGQAQVARDLAQQIIVCQKDM